MAFYMGEIVKLREAFLENHQKGEYSKAVLLGKKIVDIYKENDDCHSLEYATDLNNLAIAYDDICLYDKASTHYQTAAQIKKEISGESISYADTLNNLAIVYTRNQKFQEAVKLQQQVLQIRDKYLGHNHADYIMGLYNLANTYEDMNMIEKALETQHKALLKAQRQTALGKLDYADILNSMGRIYEKAGNYKKSLESCRKAIEMIERSTGTDNFYYMDTLLNAASVAEKSALFHKAAQYCKKAVTVRARIMDKAHLDYISALNHLSTMHTKAEEHQAALAVHEETLKLLGKILGREHIFYADTLHNIAMDYCSLEKFDLAKKYANDALELKKELVGEENAQYAISLVTTGILYTQMKEFKEALCYLKEALLLRVKLYGEQDILCADTYMTIGKAYHAQGDVENASKMFQMALDIRRQKKERNDQGYIWTLQALGALKAKQKNEEMAMGLLWEACQLQKENYGSQHPLYARAIIHLARGYMDLGRLEDGAAAFEDGADLEEKMLGESNPRYLKTLSELANARYQNGEYEKAIICFQKHNDTNFENTPAQQMEAAKEILWISNCFLQMNDIEKAQAYYQRGLDKFGASGQVADEQWNEILKERMSITARGNANPKSEQLIKKTQRIYQGNYQGNEKKEREQVAGNVFEVPENGEDKENYLRDAAELLLKIYDMRIADGGQEDREALQAALAMGDVHKIAEDFDQAFFWYQKAEKHGKGDLYAEACLKQGQIYVKQEIFEQAEAKLVLAKNCMEQSNITQTKEYTQALGLLGDIYYDSNRHLEALEVLSLWAKQFKKYNGDAYEYNAHRLLLLGEMLLAEKQQKEALEFFSEAALLIREREGESPRFAKLLLKSAKLHILLGQKEKGIMLLEKASVLYVDKTGTKRLLYGKIQEMLGNQYFEKQLTDKAEFALETAYNIFLDNSDGPSFTPKSKRNLLNLYKNNKENRKYWLVQLGKKL